MTSFKLKGFGSALSVALMVFASAAGAQEDDGDTRITAGGYTKIEGNPAAACGNLAYITTQEENIKVLDIKEERVVATIPTDPGPINPTFTPDWTKIYFSSTGGKTISVIDARVDARSREIIETFPAHQAPYDQLSPSALRFLPDGKHLVISYLSADQNGNGQGYIGIMDLQTKEVIKTIPVQDRPERFDITADGKKAYVANFESHTVSVVDLTKGEVIKTLPVGTTPFNVLVVERGQRAYVGSVRSHELIEISTVTDEIIQRIPTAVGANALSVTPDGGNILITNVYNHSLQSYNLYGETLSDPIPIGFLPGHMRLTPDGLKGIIVRPYGRQASIIDANKLEIIKDINLGISPASVAICGNP